MRTLSKLTRSAVMVVALTGGIVSCNYVLGLNKLSDACVVTDCPAPANPCQVAICEGTTCGAANVPEGTAVAGQTQGICSGQVCDGNGSVKTQEVVPGTACTSATGAGICNDAGACVGCVIADCPVPANPCQVAICAGMTCGVANAAAGTAVPGQVSGGCGGMVCDGNGGTMQQDVVLGMACAGEAGTGVCNDAGACVGCNGGGDCDSGVCAQSQCAAPTCSDGVKNGDETGTDCGGSCPACADGMGCGKPADCTGGACDMGKCCTPTTCATLGLTCGTASDGCGGTLDCNDGVKDGTETDVDCGGKGDVDAGVPACPPCVQSKTCGVAGDCATGFCADGVCCDTVCNTACAACNLAGFVGACTPTPKDQSYGGCTVGKKVTCNGAGQCVGLTGAPCSVGTTCLSGVCESNGECM